MSPVLEERDESVGCLGAGRPHRVERARIGADAALAADRGAVLTHEDPVAALGALGVGVHDPHQWNVDFRLHETVAFARTTDPNGLLNPGKLNADYTGPTKGSIR